MWWKILDVCSQVIGEVNELHGGIRLVLLGANGEMKLHCGINLRNFCTFIPLT